MRFARFMSLVAGAIALVTVCATPAMAGTIADQVPAPGSVVTQAQLPKIQASFSDAAGIQFVGSLKLDGVLLRARSTWDSYDRPTRTVFVASKYGVANGTHTVRAAFKTASGQDASATWSFSVEVPPTLSLPLPAVGSTVTSVAPAISVAVASNGPFVAIATVDGQPAPTVYFSSSSRVVATPAPLIDGVHLASIKVIDLATGATATHEWTFAVATAPAAFATPLPSGGSTIDADSTGISVVCDDSSAVSSATVTVDGLAVPCAVAPSAADPTVATISCQPRSYSDGAHSVVVRAVNAAGRASTYGWGFSVAAAPVFGGVSPVSASSVTSLAPAMYALVKDNSAVATWSVSVDGVVSPSAYDAPSGRLTVEAVRFADESAHQVVFSAADAGGRSASRTTSFTVNLFSEMPVQTDCLSCHPGRDGLSHSWAPCSSCHGIGRPVSARPHPWSDCSVCHSRTQVIDCRTCHDGRTAETHRRDAFRVNAKSPFACDTCHGESRPEGMPGHAAGVVAAHGTTQDVSSCQPCHSGSLTKEHNARTDAGGAGLTCATCHASADARVVAAIAAKDTRCGACHNLGAGGDAHEVLHAVSNQRCAGCHESSLTSEHMGRGLTCDTCHANARPEVASAIVAGDRSCAACHGPNHTLDVTFCGGCHTGTRGAWNGPVAATSHRHVSGLNASRAATSYPGTTYAANECANCHADHRGGYRASGDALCITCHDVVGVTLGSDYSYRGSTAYAVSGHATQLCAGCHVPHAATDASGAAIAAGLTAREGWLCTGAGTGCHAVGANAAGGTNVAAEFAGTDARTRHDVKLTNGTPAAGAIACSSCHDPHANNALLKASEPDTISAAAASPGAAFCLACHDGTGASGVSMPSSMTSVASVWTTGTLSDLHGPRAGTGFSGTLKPGWTRGQAAIPCATCHDEHGSDNLYHIKSDVSGTSGIVVRNGSELRNLCAACHAGTVASWHQPCYDCHNVSGGHGGSGLDANGSTNSVTPSFKINYPGATSDCLLCHNHGSKTYVGSRKSPGIQDVRTTGSCHTCHNYPATF